MQPFLKSHFYSHFGKDSETLITDLQLVRGIAVTLAIKTRSESQSEFTFVSYVRAGALA